jgi:hypothetical protein
MSIKTREFPNNKELSSALPIEFKVFIPSTRDKNVVISTRAFERRVDESIKFFSKRFGGSTIDVQTGTYVLKNKVIKEKVAVITVSSSVNDYNRYDEQIEIFLKKKKQSWGQDSMGFIYNNRMVFV